MQTFPLMYPHRKKSVGVKSGDRGGHGRSPPINGEVTFASPCIIEEWHRLIVIEVKTIIISYLFY